MRRAGAVSLLLVAALCSGCLINTELYEERWDELAAELTPGGGYGVRFSASPDCIQVDVSGLELDGPFSFDAYIWPDAGPGFGKYPVVAWPGMFALYQDEYGYTVAGPADEPAVDLSAHTPTSIMDGAYHHLAINYGQNGTMSIYRDGLLKGYAEVEFTGEVSETLYLGCWPGEEATFAGVIGEARLSDSALYSGDFDPEWLPYKVADATVGLWHLDEGEGEDVLDEAGGHDGVLVGGFWEHFYLGPEQ